MNLSLSIHTKGFVISPLTSDMMIKIIIMTIYFATFFSFSFSSSFFAPNIGAKAFAQVDNNSNNSSTLILEDLRAIMRDQQRDIASINNMTSAEVELIKNMESLQLEELKDINTVSTKLATQGAYTALSVFFLGIGLVVFGLRLTSKTPPRIGRSMTIMVWALTIPVIILIGLFQYGVITGTGTSLISAGEEPFSLLSFLLYIPIAIVIFLLLEEKGIVQEQSAHISGPILEMEKLVRLKERGMITEEEFQKLKAELMAKL
ncbi:MAG TPA: SHOCT domain-containing protein [Nitrososphaeraceae archaeon]|nr:SHOCT domain-containing protein [Nitrososphaeraceae archaeon]